ncbi:DnaJ domain-containing protein [Leptotrichia sp. oral taxon 218]|uniref:J domain-containing protein n=1 Tax=Leptotrichia sp. oral taxon 218 TaxID=712361 RepID=UPI001B8AD07C|nr:DnaJ domain-containing protein [Leptotrichia sp. oral taxon 218]QUB94854.1 DnaJ domain-containing protein [Leptotrichia sp. oral taxon 218]
MILNFDEAFKILEIEPTNDKKKIKIAYSKMLKKYHPEEFPEMFMKINEAYRVALEFEKFDFNEINFNKGNFRNKNFFEIEQKSEKDGYEEVSFGNDIQKSEIENEEFSDIFNGKYEWMEKNFKSWIKEIRRILNGEKVSFIYLKVFLKRFDKFSDDEKSRIRDILGLENNDFEDNLILKSENLFEFEKEYIISCLSNNKNEFGEIKGLYNSKEKKDNDKALENFVERYFNVKKLNIFGFFIFWNIYRGNYKYFDIKINKRIHNLFFNSANNFFFKRIVYSYKKIKNIFYHLEITCEDDIGEDDAFIHTLIFLLSCIALIFICIFSLPAIINTKEIDYRNVVKSFELVRIYWIVLTVTRIYLDFSLAKRGNNLNMASMLNIQIILLGSYLISIYFNYKIKDFLLFGILIWMLIKLIIVNRIKYLRLKNYAKKILDKIYN